MRRRTRALFVLLGYALLALGATWPLARHFRTELTGDVNGDTGVYVWNLWIFRHELVEHRRAPFSTDHLFAYTGGDDFTLHNYTPVAGAAAAPLIEPLGLVATFNLIYLALIVTTALGTYLLARRCGLAPPLAWIAGALFAASPVLIAKGTAHFSLVAAAPLPLFLWALFRTLDSTRVRDGVLVGLITAWATYSDAYYGIYCALMGLVVLGWRFLRLQTPGARARPVAVSRVVDALLLVLAAVVAWRLQSGIEVLTLGPVTLSIRTLYTPVLVITALALLRVWLVARPVPRVREDAPPVRRLVPAGAAAVLAAAAGLAPLLFGLALRAAAGQLPATPIFWRSSPRGVDLLAYLAPNPSHPLFGPHVARLFLPERGDAFPEYVAAFPLTALVVIAVAAWRRALPGFWVFFTAVFVALSLGPFVNLAGVNTEIPGPWAVLRYLPAIGMARSPSRFAIVAALGLSILFVFALRAWLDSLPATRRWLAAGVVGLLAFEALPAPRTLYSADVPEVYRIIAASSDDDARVLELPTGIRDGTSSIGDFSPAEQYYQTQHHRPLLGGYLSRVSAARRERSLRLPVLGPLLRLSSGEPLDPEAHARAIGARDRFLRKACVGFVVVDRTRASGELVAFAHDVLQLELLHEDPRYALYVPRDRPPCDARRSAATADEADR